VAASAEAEAAVVVAAVAEAVVPVAAAAGTEPNRDALRVADDGRMGFHPAVLLFTAPQRRSPCPPPTASVAGVRSRAIRAQGRPTIRLRIDVGEFAQARHTLTAMGLPS
jgi:hypothetical protein